MGPHPGHATAPPPRVFNYSLDWRFLLPMADPKRVCLVFEDDADFSETLERVGIQAGQRLSLSDLQRPKNDSFQLLAMPFGLPTGWAGPSHKERVDFFFSVRRFLGPEGYLLVGFRNALNPFFRSQTSYCSSTPRGMAHELKQAGFKSVKFFGAMPDLQIPEYIFGLEPGGIQFALQNRFRRKPAFSGVLRALAGGIGWKGLSNFLPCYFALGTV